MGYGLTVTVGLWAFDPEAAMQYANPNTDDFPIFPPPKLANRWRDRRAFRAVAREPHNLEYLMSVAGLQYRTEQSDRYLTGSYRFDRSKAPVNAYLWRADRRARDKMGKFKGRENPLFSCFSYMFRGFGFLLPDGGFFLIDSIINQSFRLP